MDEPTIELLDGQVVLRAVFDLVRTLLAQGYSITIVDAEVRVTPPVSENAWYVLDLNWSDTAAVLEQLEIEAPTPRRETTTIH